MKIVSWNINSVRFRIEIVQQFLREAAPDILCLQETKVIDGDFPVAAFLALGYPHILLHGQRMHHGVAIVSRVPLVEDDRLDWQANREARHIGVRLPNGVRLENVYVPAGGDVPDRAVNPKFGQKLDFIERMTRWSEDLACPTILTGDFNIAPLPSDVWSHKALLKVVSHTPVEVDALDRLKASNAWVDLGRHFHPAPMRLHTWWSYRSPDWTVNDRGRRLDHMWATRDVAAAATAHHVFEGCRSWLKPSDHVPIMTEFAFLSDRAAPDPKQAARAIDALRRGWPVRIGALSLLPIETADAVRLAAFDPAREAGVLISAGRAATLKLANQIEAAAPDAPVLIDRAPWLDFAAATALSDPQFDLATPLKGPFRATPLLQRDDAAAALRFARIAGLLPAFFVRDGGAAEVALSLADIDAHEEAARLTIAARARLPIDQADTAEIVAFRTPESPGEHIALLIGQPNGRAPLVRLHSECLTGDALGSLKCDCGPQLDAAIAAIVASGWGVLLYLRQEGRGIGLVNKLRAYALQDQGFDTVDANTRLGFAIDARDFRVAARMLDLLGQRSIRLLTNNPAKVAALETAGIAVVERVPHHLPANPHNERYLATKRDRTGHQL